MIVGAAGMFGSIVGQHFNRSAEVDSDKFVVAAGFESFVEIDDIMMNRKRVIDRSCLGK